MTRRRNLFAGCVPSGVDMTRERDLPRRLANGRFQRGVSLDHLQLDFHFQLDGIMRHYRNDTGYLDECRLYSHQPTSNESGA